MHLQHPLVLPALLATGIISHVLPPSRLRAAFSIPLLLALLAAFSTRPLSTDIAASYGAATLAWTFTLRSIALHLSGTIEHTHHRPAIEEPGAPATYSPLRKLAWVLSLLASPRAVGWEPTYVSRGLSRIPPFFLAALRTDRYKTLALPYTPRAHAATPRSRPAYVLWALKRAAGSYLALDLARTYNLAHPAPLARGITLPDLLAFGTCAWAAIEMQYCALAAVAVATHASEPCDWPRLFGSPRDAYTVARFWGRTWHQLLRGAVGPLARALRCEGRLAATALAFAVSGLGHAYVSWTVRPRGPAGAGAGAGANMLCFFWSQGVAVAVEAAVMQAWPEKWRGGRWGAWWRVAGYGPAWRPVGYVWTAAVVLGAACWQVRDVEMLGMQVVEPVPWSVVRPLLAMVKAREAGVLSSVDMI
ncbi:membrane bound O-acyl transferase family-domain-containing protein [Geopyxis carbonaria]|nr:membrane bound O-acyl transferase family-domain-containing protein [Geopyxis carbonaria]